MRFLLAAVTPRRQSLRPGPARDLFELYVGRIAQYAPVEVVFPETEAALLERLRRGSGRVPPHAVLLDSRGKQLSSEAFATRLGHTRDAGTQQMVLAVGPASGWSNLALAGAAWSLSLGVMTLPHELALTLLAEQLYRAHTILTGHPYHSSH